MTLLPNTPRWHRRVALAVGIAALTAPLRAQTPVPGPLLDALSITVQFDSTTVARGSLRLRQVRTGAEVDLVASGIVVQRGLRVTAELRTDTLFTLRRYVAETRDSAGTVIDRIQVTSAGGRITYERVTHRRRIMREYLAQRDLMILDSAAIVPFVMLAGMPPRSAPITLLDARSTLLVTGTVTIGQPVDLSIAEVQVSGTPLGISGRRAPLQWWRDPRGRLLRIAWGERARVVRDDPPT